MNYFNIQKNLTTKNIAEYILSKVSNHKN